MLFLCLQAGEHPSILSVVAQDKTDTGYKPVMHDRRGDAQRFVMNKLKMHSSECEYIKLQ